jgi:hypothetical protein
LYSIANNRLNDACRCKARGCAWESSPSEGRDIAPYSYWMNSFPSSLSQFSGEEFAFLYGSDLIFWVLFNLQGSVWWKGCHLIIATTNIFLPRLVFRKEKQPVDHSDPLSTFKPISMGSEADCNRFSSFTVYVLFLIFCNFIQFSGKKILKLC